MIKGKSAIEANEDSMKVFETACEKLSMVHERIPNNSSNSNAHIEHSIKS